MSPYRSGPTTSTQKVFRGSVWAYAKLGALGALMLAMGASLLVTAPRGGMVPLVSTLVVLAAATVSFLMEARQLHRFSVSVSDDGISFRDGDSVVEMPWNDVREVTKTVEGRTVRYELRATEGRLGEVSNRVRGFQELERLMAEQLKQRRWVALDAEPSGRYRAPSRRPVEPSQVRVEESAEGALEHEETVDDSDASTHTRARERHV